MRSNVFLWTKMCPEGVGYIKITTYNTTTNNNDNVRRTALLNQPRVSNVPIFPTPVKAPRALS